METLDTERGRGELDRANYRQLMPTSKATAWRLHWSYWGKSQGFGSEPGGDEIMETKANA